jgi:hypothetical protein
MLRPGTLMHVAAPVCVLGFGTMLLAGQSQPAPRSTGTAWTVGRTADGQPDLQGMWTNYDSTPFERLDPGQTVAPRIAVSTQDWLVQDSPRSPRRASMIVDPPDGKVPLRPEAIAKRDAAQTLDADAIERYGPWERCITRGVPGSMWPGAYNNGHQIIQTRDFVVLYSEMIHEARVIPLDGRPRLGPAARSWDGDSRGRWDGETLVIETSNFNGRGWSATNAAAGALRGIPQSQAAHVVERLTRVSEDTIQYEATVGDPEVFTRPWTVAFPLNKDDKYQIFEYACHEGNEAMQGMLRGHRYGEKAGAPNKSNNN